MTNSSISSLNTALNTAISTSFHSKGGVVGEEEPKGEKEEELDESVPSSLAPSAPIDNTQMEMDTQPILIDASNQSPVMPAAGTLQMMPTIAASGLPTSAEKNICFTVESSMGDMIDTQTLVNCSIAPPIMESQDIELLHSTGSNRVAAIIKSPSIDLFGRQDNDLQLRMEERPGLNDLKLRMGERQGNDDLQLRMEERQGNDDLQLRMGDSPNTLTTAAKQTNQSTIPANNPLTLLSSSPAPPAVTAKSDLHSVLIKEAEAEKSRKMNQVKMTNANFSVVSGKFFNAMDCTSFQHFVVSPKILRKVKDSEKDKTPANLQGKSLFVPSSNPKSTAKIPGKL